MAQAPPLVVYVHLIAALAAFALGAFQLARPKGTSSHRAFGWTWAALMLAVAISSLWIPRLLHFTWIHLFTLLTLVTLPLALWSAHRGDVIAHQKGMKGLYLGGMVIAGVFALAPGRLLGNAVWHGAWGYLPRV
jgi:uncharacterized membrane protein